jgi:uncharacterized metal-binding protein YceD (DUF177 family)
MRKTKVRHPAPGITFEIRHSGFVISDSPPVAYPTQHIMNLQFDPTSLPDDGLELEGSLPSSFFELPEGDPVRPMSPLEYRLHVTKDEEGVLFATGEISATFELDCGRCLEPFQLRIEQTDFAHEIPLENGTPDLTNLLREDILLALPTYPRCETGNVTPRECPAEGRFDSPTDSSGEESPEAQDPNTWEALDQLTNLKKN